jgi:hypothetical protein
MPNGGEDSTSNREAVRKMAPGSFLSPRKGSFGKALKIRSLGVSGSKQIPIIPLSALTEDVILKI